MSGWLEDLAARFDVVDVDSDLLREERPASAAEPRLSPASLALATSPGFALPPHIDALDRAIVRTVSRGGRLVVGAPPRHGKSEETSRFTPAWFLGRWPSRQVVVASYEADFARSWGRKARDLLEAHGRRLFGDVRVRQDTSAADRWEIAGHGGGMVTAGMGGALTGRGADLLIVDDPFKNLEDADSAANRQRVWDWFTAVALTRLEPGASVIVVSTRWHLDDLVGRLLREQPGEWEVLEFPALAEEGDALGRAPGEPLWPERYGVEALQTYRRQLGSRLFSALYQCRPVPAEGEIFKAGWLRRYAETEQGYGISGQWVQREFVRRFCTVDLAVSTKTSADFTVIATWGVTPRNDLLLLDLVRRRMEAPDIVPALRSVHERWRPALIGVEATAFQLGIVQAAQRDGLPVTALRPDRDKLSRAYTAAAFAEAGRLWLPAFASWLADFESELLAFPAAKHDDQVDVLSYAAAEVQLGRWRGGGEAGYAVARYEGFPYFDEPDGREWFTMQDGALVRSAPNDTGLPSSQVAW